jgi:hypothetical protein
MLLIDLGGDDVYRNHPGSAPFTAPGDPSVANLVSVHVDLAGDDTYTPQPVPGPAGEQVFSNGVGATGVGFSIDLAGDDFYRAEVLAGDQDTPGVGFASGWAQGAGFAGIGVLYDGEGDDQYALLGQSNETNAVRLFGQGFGGYGGLAAGGDVAGVGAGALVDRGLGTDSYETAASLRPGARYSAYADPNVPAWAGGIEDDVQAQAASWVTSLGLLSDDGAPDGGHDAFLLGTEQRRVSVADVPIPSAESKTFYPLWGQAATNSGTAILLAGEGDTSYRTVSRGEGTTLLAQRVQGVADPGVAVLLDTGGNDSYDATISNDEVANVAVDDTCGDCDPSFDLVAIRTMTQQFAQGWGAAGAGILDDRNGDDVYRSSSTSMLTAEALDSRTAPEAGVGLTVIGGPLTMGVQGIGYLGGLGALLDQTGTDRYEATLLAPVDASVRSTASGGPPSSVVAVSGSGQSVLAQGSASLGGNGVLLDGGGVGDEFSAAAASPVTTDPTDWGYDMSWLPNVQGAATTVYGGAGTGTLIALGSETRIVSSPTRPPVCLDQSTARGFETWADCSAPGVDHRIESVDGPVIGWGRAPGSSGTSPTVEFVDPTSTALRGDAPLRFTIRASGAQGVPVEDALAHAVLQYRRPSPSPLAGWSTLWHGTDMRTDDRGEASIEIPGTGAFAAALSGSWNYRVLIILDSAPGRRAAYAATGVQLAV